METATFGAGCFWGVEETFRTTEGVTKTTVGFMGGKTKNPTYEDVCYNETGHAEVVQLEYDPEKISYEKILDIFWKCHNPTTLNQDGPNIGEQYRSAIFYHTEEQKAAAEKSKELEQTKRTRSIVTEIVPATEFTAADEYHQKYLMKRGSSSCHI